MSHYQDIIDDLLPIADFRINDLDESLEVKMSGQEWQPMDDTIEAIIRVKLREIGYGIKGKGKANRTAVSEAWTMRGHKQRYNPIKDYLQSLSGKYEPRNAPSGNVEPYIIPEFCTLFDNPDGMFNRWLFRWMVGSIAKVYQQERNPMLVMSGEQEIGKSTFIRWLCPLPDRYREGAIKPDNKDDRLRLADTWIQEVPELGSTTRKADVEELKDYITRKEVRERPPYGKRPITKPSVCSFVASVNFDGAGFLVDTTGNTRFLVSEINHINFAYSKRDLNDLWAEAYWFYTEMYRQWELTPHEKQARRDINNQYQMVNPLDDVIDHYLDITHDPDDFMPTLQIRDYLAPHYKATTENVFGRELARSLKARGLTRKRMPYNGPDSPHRWGWAGIRTNDDATIKMDGDK